ncbi:MAG: YaiI/YqxD family protein [Bacillota bacterium]
MRILIDADSCPVIKNVEKIAKKFSIKVIIIKNYNHQINSAYSKVISVDPVSENVDFKIVNISKEGDIIVTQDYGLCGMVISENIICINQYGKIINNKNIDRLLLKRDINRDLRKKHNVYTKFSKRTFKDDKKFEKSLKKLINDFK